MAWYETAWKALSEAKLDVAGAAAIASFICIGLDRYQIVDLQYLLWLFWTVGVFAASLFVSRVVRLSIEHIRALWKDHKEHRSYEDRKRLIFGKLELLSPDEEQTLAWLVQKNQITLEAEFGSPVVQALHNKSLLIPASGTGDVFSWPYTVPDPVWAELQRTRDRWMKVKVRTKPLPWRRPII